MPDTAVPAVPARRPLDGLLAWVKGREREILLAAVAFQVLFLAAMVVKAFLPHWTGDTVLVRVVPVDPRDLFRGDYVILGYDFSRIPPGGVEGLPLAGPGSQGQAVYVPLEPEGDGRHWRGGRPSIHRPAAGKYLRGRLGPGGRIEFGIESYFVQEGQGLKYEQAVRTGHLSAEIVVAPDGQAALRGLHVE